jgi:hypothetical protein
MASESAPIVFIQERNPGGGRCKPALLRMFVSIKKMGPVISKPSDVGESAKGRNRHVPVFGKILVEKYHGR